MAIPRDKRIIRLLVVVLAAQSILLAVFSYKSAATEESQAQFFQDESIASEGEIVIPPEEIEKIIAPEKITPPEDVPHKDHPKRRYNFFNEGKNQDLCKTEDSFYRMVSLDPHNRFVKPIDRSSPFQNCSSGIDFSRAYVPSRAFSRSLNAHKYGGFTADIGWVLMVARLALYEGKAMSFPEYWGHGCDGSSISQWTCFFEPITLQDCLPEDSVQQKFSQENTEDRHRAKLAHVYNDKDLYKKRNLPITKYFDETFAALIGGDNDLQTMRQVFQWTFKPNYLVTQEVMKWKPYYMQQFGLSTTPFIAVHLRGGDKIGKNADGPLEAYAVPMLAYALTIHCLARYHNVPKLIFVATDDFDLLQAFKQEVGEDFEVVSSASIEDKGFGVNRYRQDKHLFTEKKKFDEAVKLWIDMEILKEGEYFVSCMQSNVARILHLMRYQPTNTTVRVPIHASQSSNCCSTDSPSKRMANCRSLCN